MKLAEINHATKNNAAITNNGGATDDNECTVREQDRFMPTANVIRIMRKILPLHAKISDDAKGTIQECVSEYISFITGEANEHCQREQRRTITAEDVLWAMSKLGFDDYIEPLTLYLHRFHEMEGDRGSMRAESTLIKTTGGTRAAMTAAEYHAAAAAGSFAAGFAPFHHHHGFFGYLKDGTGTSLSHQALANGDHLQASSHYQYDDNSK
ncbi:hypothetical protein ACLB2K_025304 [Fragaria x ananassa]